MFDGFPSHLAAHSLRRTALDTSGMLVPPPAPAPETEADAAIGGGAAAGVHGAELGDLVSHRSGGLGLGSHVGGADVWRPRPIQMAVTINVDPHAVMLAALLLLVLKLVAPRGKGGVSIS